ncbi:MAG: class I SAM-dependent methyltransferase [Candidatus Omnitrophica bacterium]|nr:class I SAM-dependent methyltransferase [Candidatus Omnitrophota bacterium]
MDNLDYAKEKKRLNEIGPEFFSEKAMTIDKKQILMMVRRALPYVKGPKVLEMSYNDRGWTDALMDKGFDLTVIEGSKFNVDYAKKKFAARLNIIHTLFEEYQPKEKFDTIVMSCIIEHVVDSLHVVKLAASWLKPDGIILIVVPNMVSLHRRIGYHCGMLKSLDELSENDHAVGHRKLYTVKSIKKEVMDAGLYSGRVQGIFLKPLSSDKLVDWSDELLNAFDKMGNELVEYAGFLFVPCYKDPSRVPDSEKE